MDDGHEWARSPASRKSRRPARPPPSRSPLANSSHWEIHSSRLLPPEPPPLLQRQQRGQQQGHERSRQMFRRRASHTSQPCQGGACATSRPLQSRSPAPSAARFPAFAADCEPSRLAWPRWRRPTCGPSERLSSALLRLRAFASERRWQGRKNA
jgi:hypothetical protein